MKMGGRILRGAAKKVGSVITGKQSLLRPTPKKKRLSPAGLAKKLFNAKIQAKIQKVRLSAYKGL